MRKIIQFVLVMLSVNISLFSQNTQKGSLGIITPFSVNNEHVPADIIRDMKVNTIIPESLQKSLSKASYLTKVENISEFDKGFDFYLKGEIIQICRGNPGLRRYAKDDRGFAFVVLKLKLLDKDRKLISEGEIGEKSFGCSVFNVWVNSKHIEKAIENCSISARTLIENLIDKKNQTNPIWLEFFLNKDNEKKDPWDVFKLWKLKCDNGKDLKDQLESQNYFEIRKCVRSINVEKKFNDIVLTDKVERIIINYLAMPDDSDTAVDALAWCCIILQKSKNNKYLSTLEKVLTCDVAKKIKKAAKNAVKGIGEA